MTITRSASGAADDLCGTLGFVQRIDDVEVERLAGRSGFLRAVEDGDLLYRSGQRIHEMLYREGAIEADFEKADFFSTGGESFDGFMSGLSAGTHHDDNALGIGGADVVEKMVRAADDLSELVHDRLHFFGCSVVDGIDGLAHLEKDVRVLGGAAEDGMLGRERALAMLKDAIHVDHRSEERRV